MATDIDFVHGFLRDEKRPVPMHEIVERIVRHDYETRHKEKIYSPEQRYDRGDRIAVLYPTDGGGTELRLGFVLEVRSRGSTVVDDLRLHYNPIRIRFDNGDLREYVSCCPEFPARFHHEGDFVTPGQIAIRNSVMVEEVEKELRQDHRFVSFEKKWSLRELLSAELQGVSKVGECLVGYILSKKSQVAPVQDLVAVLQNQFHLAIGDEMLEFNINVIMDKNEWLTYASRDDRVFWLVKPPPNFAINTLTSEQIERGIIKVTDSLRKILFVLGRSTMGSEIDFGLPNNASLHGRYDGRDIITSSEIREWFHQIELQEGDRLFIGFNELGKLQLVPRYFGPPPEEVITTGGGAERNLREEIYKILFAANEYLHIRDIHARLQNALADDITIGGVGSVLSINQHLFKKHRVAHGLWGLIQWDVEIDIDRDSILKAIEDGDLAFEALSRIRRPMSYHEIARQIADYLGVRIMTIEQVAIFVAKYFEHERVFEMDNRFQRGVDGRWILRAWRDEEERKAKLEEELREKEEEVEQLKNQLTEHSQRSSILYKDEVLCTRNRNIWLVVLSFSITAFLTMSFFGFWIVGFLMIGLLLFSLCFYLGASRRIDQIKRRIDRVLEEKEMIEKHIREVERALSAILRQLE